LAAPFGDEPCFEAGDIASGVGLDFVDPHVVNDHAPAGGAAAAAPERGALAGPSAPTSTSTRRALVTM
jgi:hypothetical protein